ncbi:MAG: glycogen synthase GlgA [Rhodocyclaceae bacterium]|nr:glycogen synthase GlgA [Rhodocyclaceae bacterium]MBX3668104.1 glycogen synthase GlgA [Rhodocyclaceae bacterium]
MKVLFVTSEIAPWVKTGGLGDVAAALPGALVRAGCEVQVLVPCYPALATAFPQRRYMVDVPPLGGLLPEAQISVAQAPDGFELLLLECPVCYERYGNPYLGSDLRDWSDNAVRFGLLSRVAAWLATESAMPRVAPDLLHCHDWQAAMAPAYLRYRPGKRRAASVVTIHNLAFQGLFDPHMVGDIGLPPDAFTFDGVEFHGRLCFLKAGLECAQRITTVSPTYAQEIQDYAYGYGLEGLLRHRAGELSGILNGIDTVQWNPATDKLIAADYGVDSLARKAANKRALQRQLGLAERADAPLLGMVSRMTEQKGCDLVLGEAVPLLEAGAQFAVLGAGERRFAQHWQELARRYPDQCGAAIGYDERLAHQIEAGADIFLMPSRFEPCGLNQMYSLRYGTPPVVRRTGGLADTVVDCTPATLAQGRANGFVFTDASRSSFLHAVERAIAAWRDASTWQHLQRAGMTTDFSWDVPARAYLSVYERARAAL